MNKKFWFYVCAESVDCDNTLFGKSLFAKFFFKNLWINIVYCEFGFTI